MIKNDQDGDRGDESHSERNNNAISAGVTPVWLRKFTLRTKGQVKHYFERNWQQTDADEVVI